MAPPRIWTPEQAQAWRIEYETGASIIGLARGNTVASGTMRAALLDAGTTLREYDTLAVHERLVAVTPLMVADYQSGMSIRAVAAKHRVSKTSAQRALTRAGVVMRDRHGRG